MGSHRWKLLPYLLLIGCTSGLRAQETPLTPAALQTALSALPSGVEAEALADRIREWFGKENLLKGPNPKIDGLSASWAIEAPGAISPPQVKAEGDDFKLALQRVGDTDVYAATASLPDGAAFRWAYEVDSKRQGGGQFEIYTVPPENRQQPDVPKGTLTQREKWRSIVYDGTLRDWWVYVPAEYKPDGSAALMVFQDGGSYKDRIPIIFDNMIAKGEMPVTVGVFINPGTFTTGRSNRSLEYDTLSDRYARFLIEELLPELEKTVKVSPDPANRAIMGASSGGICAWTVAWQRPDQFGKVISWIGSFTNIASGPSLREGGHNYPALIRKTDPKPIRVFLQDGANDLDNAHGNWPLANQQMAKALAFKGYDYKFVYGNGFHTYNHGWAILPDALRWLWRKDK